VQCGQGASKEAKAEPVKSGPKITVSVPEIEITAFDVEGGKAASSQKISPPKKLSYDLNIAENQKLIVKFAVKNAADNQNVKADQAFVRLTNVKADREVALVADADGNAYKVEVDLTKKGADFNRLNGVYEVHVEVGDFGFSNAVSALVGNVKLNFPNGVDEVSSSSDRFASRPEIKHLFREPEKRPPATVSTAFSFAVMVPFVLLWLLWAKLGINFRNFDVHPSALVFYASLGGIFYLYYMFWLSLDMFTTLKYLSGLGLVAFFSGSMFFARMNRRRTGKEVKEQ